MRSHFFLNHVMRDIRESYCDEKFSDLMGNIAVAKNTHADPASKYFQHRTKEHTVSFFKTCDFATHFKQAKLDEHQLTLDDLSKFIPKEEIESIKHKK